MNNNNNSNDNNATAAPIPVGFRFHPTDEELVGYYLHGKVGRAQRDQLIQELDLYKIEPWDLHELCRIGDDAAENQSDWYFFSHKDKKYPTGNRANRATTAGFWKATGRDKPIHTQHRHVIGMRKTLVFYLGRAPHGQKTDWIMHEFRLDSDNNGPGGLASPGNYESEGWVVCRVFRKTKNFKTKSQEDTSCSFETDTEPPNNSNNNCNNQLLSEVSPNFGISSKGSGNVNHGQPDYNNHGHYNFTCKQELTVDDYPCTFTVTDSHLHHTVTGLRTRQQPHNMNQHEFQGFSTVKDFDDARSSTTAYIPPHTNNHTSHQEWMLDSGRDNVLRLHSGAVSRRDQTLADVTCHLHVKRQQTAAFLSHENLVHLWN